MAYLPGVPDMGPAPVSPGAKSTVGSPKGIAATAHAVGKPSNVQHLGTVVGRRGAGLTSLGGGDPAMHSLGHYGKKGSPLFGNPQMTGGTDPTAHAGAKVIRGQSGAMRSHIREGGLGPGPLATPGPSNTDYSLNSSDTE